ncbi:MAG: hypothetical protein J07HR59_00877 [Halorubrum sp. J07HR59]|nr:MAG: hypothetical protein J07HR59_00877 [Halorubrum sp. J07HR59]
MKFIGSGYIKETHRLGPAVPSTRVDVASILQHERYTASRESFLLAQLFATSLAIVTLTAGGVESYSVYILVVYVVSAIVTEALLPSAAVAGWQRRVWRVIQAAGVIVALVLFVEVARVVRESGVIA